ncbi:MAG: TetR family transcriptional regulator [Solirubrobacterales bacterium]
MSSTGDKTTTSRRRHDSEATREALLRAAREIFDECGFERATTRAIGERAGVDAALIARYFAGKEGLFLAAIGSMSEEEDRDLEPSELVALLIERWERKGHNPISRALASPALSEDVRREVSEIVAQRLLRNQAARLRGRGLPDAELRAELLIAVAVGVEITRANGTLERLAATPLDEVVAVLDPFLEALGSAGGGDR